MLPKNRPPSHPGEVLLEDCIKPLGLTQAEAARRLGVPIQRLNGLVRGRRAMSPDTALRVAAVFGSSPEFWMNLQANWDLWRARAAAAKDLRHLRPIKHAA
jgi:addiction module HigA family antidote